MQIPALANSKTFCWLTSPFDSNNRLKSDVDICLFISLTDHLEFKAFFKFLLGWAKRSGLRRRLILYQY
jgi:hypothetical protein